MEINEKNEGLVRDIISFLLGQADMLINDTPEETDKEYNGYAISSATLILAMLLDGRKSVEESEREFRFVCLGENDEEMSKMRREEEHV